MKVAAVAFTIIGLLVAGITIFYVVIRPWLRDRRPTFDGLMLLAFITMLWQDDAANFYRPLITYNSWMTNFGSWYGYIPGWISPGGNRIAEPILWDWPLYVYFWLPACLLGCLVMRKASDRWPTLGRLGQAGLAFATFAVLDLILEVGFWTRLGLYTYPGASGWLTLFRGHYYQFPLYETIALSAMWTVLSSVRQFKNADGESIVERGVRKLQGGQRKRTLFTFLALVGLCNATFLGYNVTVATIGMYQSGWPHDTQIRSYLLDGQCGAGTPYACPTPNLPKGHSGTH